MANDRAQFEMIFDVIMNGADRAISETRQLQEIVDKLGKTSQITASEKNTLTRALNSQATAAMKAAAAAKTNLSMEERETRATKTLAEAKEQLRLAENRIKANTRKGNTDLVARDTAQVEVQKQRILNAERDLAQVAAHRAQEDQKAAAAADLKAAADRKAAEAVEKRAAAERQRQQQQVNDAQGGVDNARAEYNAAGGEKGLEKEAIATARLERAKEQLAAAEKRVAAARGASEGDTRELVAALKAEEAALKQATTATRQHANAHREYRASLESTRYALYDVSTTAAIGAAAIIGSGVGVASIFAEWETGISQVQRTSGLAGAPMAALEDQLQGLVSTLPIAADEITTMAARAGQLGVSASGIGTFTDSISRFSAISDTLNADEAASFIARIGNLTGVDDYARLADTIARVGVNSAATDQQIARTSQELAQATAAANFTADEIIGLSAAFASLGIPPERARSVINDLVVEMEEGIAGLTERLPIFAGVIGMTADQTADLWKQDPTSFLTKFAQGINESERAVEVLSAVGLEGQRAIPVFAALAEDLGRAGTEQGSVLVQALSDAREEFATGGEVMRQYGVFLDDLATKWQLFVNNLAVAAQEMGTVFAPSIGAVLDTLTKMVQGFQDFAQSGSGQAFLELAGILGTLAAAGLTIVAVATAMGASWIAVTTVMSHFPWIRPIVTGLFGIGTASNAASVGMARASGIAPRLSAALLGVQTAAGKASVALVAFGRATLILGALAALISMVTDFQGSMYGMGDVMISVNQVTAEGMRGLVRIYEWGHNLIVDMLNGIMEGALSAANSLMAAMATVANVPQPPPLVLTTKFEHADVSGAMRNILTSVAQSNDEIRQWQSQWTPAGDAAEAALARAEAAGEAALATFDEMGEQDLDPLNDALANTEDATRKAEEAAQGALAAFKTLVDYGNDLSAVWDRAFDIRFSGQSSYDTITSSFDALRRSAIDSEQKIRDLRNTLRSLSADVAGLTSDMAIQKYYLSIATEYEGGDSERAGAIRADLAKLEAELAEKHAETADAAKDLAKENAKTSKSLEGNSEAAIENRSAMTELVSQYQEHIKSLATSGMSQADLARATEVLRQDFIRQAQQLGYNGAELQRYASAFDDVALAIGRVPRVISVTADTNPAIQALNEITARAALEGAAAGRNFADGFGGASGGLSGGFGTSGAYGSGQSAAQAYRDGFQQWMRQQPIAIEGYLMQGQQVYRVPGTGLRLFSEGGYTGRGGKYQAAGIVHKGEYVVPAQHVNQSTGLPNPDALGRLPRGSQSSGSYARGGHASSSMMPSSMELGPRSIMALARAVQPYLVIDGRVMGDTVGKANTQSTVVGAL